MNRFAPRSLALAVLTAAMSSTVAVPQIHAAQAAQQPAAAAPAQQPMSDADITARIRKDLTEDKALSGYASTLKVIVSGGLVTLKGAVRSDADKKAIEQKVAKIAGEANVMNNLFVSSEAPKPQTR
jgi:osmotically-inducible protein OsmY